jgi:hypothetical protein
MLIGAIVDGAHPAVIKGDIDRRAGITHSTCQVSELGICEFFIVEGGAPNMRLHWWVK